ncbi:MAG: hypothetical protein ABIZ81_03310 [Opitutaceae bacterium]
MAKTSKPSSASKIPWRAIIIVVVICVAAGLLAWKFDIETVHDYASGLNAAVVFVLLTLLPLVGFPVTVLHVVVGMRFGVPLGLSLVAVSIILQLLASYALVHLFRAKFAQRLASVRKRIPKAAHGSMCLFTMLLPGVPYFAKNYVLPLLGVPLRTFLLVCAPIHIARSSVAIIFGDKSDDLTPARIIGLSVYFSLTLFVSWWMFRRIRSQMDDKKPRARASAQAKAA